VKEVLHHPGLNQQTLEQFENLAKLIEPLGH
jgi:hypothetical protein